MVFNLISFYNKKPKYDGLYLGGFDGVHLGHQKLLNTVKDKENKSTLLIIFNKNTTEKIYPIEYNINLIQKFNPDLDILVMDLNEYNMQITKDEFIEFLKNLNIKNIYVGKDYKFGYQKKGSTNDLKKHFNVKEATFLMSDNKKISSTLIKESLKNGEIKLANKLLSRLYSVTGNVKKGKQLGKTIGFPTMNIKVNNVLLKSGVYKTKTKIDDKIYKSITNIGIAPTINNNNDIIVETNIVDDFDENTYDKNITVYFEEYLREEKKFNSIDELKEQIQKDISKVSKGIK